MKDTLALQQKFDAYKEVAEARIMRLTAEVADLRHRHEGGVPLSRDERIAMGMPPDPPEAPTAEAKAAAEAALLLFEDESGPVDGITLPPDHEPVEGELPQPEPEA